MLFEGLTGSPPFVRSTEVGVLYAHTNDPAPRLTAVRPQLAGAIDLVIERGMAKDPAERYQTAVQLVEAAQAALRIGTQRP